MQLKKEVMQRVKAIHYMRTVVRPLLIEGLLFIAVLIAISSLVSIPNIIINISHSPKLSSYFTFLYEAFVHTQLIVQLMLVVAIALFALLAADIIKNFRYAFKLTFRTSL